MLRDDHPHEQSRSVRERGDRLDQQLAQQVVVALAAEGESDRPFDLPAELARLAVVLFRWFPMMTFASRQVLGERGIDVRRRAPMATPPMIASVHEEIAPTRCGAAKADLRRGSFDGG
jgi:hypothetical protein